MARILLLSDHSSNALHAAAYAVHVFGRHNITYDMAHAHLEVGLADPLVPVYMPELMKAAEDGLADAARLFHERTGVPIAHQHLLLGPLPAALSALLQEQRVDAVVMGMSGSGGSALFGSTTIAVVRTSTVPVLVVPEGAALRAPRLILLADDHAVVAPDDLAPLRTIAERNGAEVLITHVPTSGAEGVMHWSHGVYELGLAGVQHRFAVARGAHVAQAIEQAVLDEHADLLAVVHRHTGLVERLLHPSLTEQLVRHSDRPLFVLEQHA